MAYKLTNAAVLARMTERAHGVLTVRMEDGREYGAQELLALCKLSGLEYTVEQYQQIAQALMEEGFLEKT